MNNTVYISGPMLDDADLKMLENQPFTENTEFEIVPQYGLIDPGAVQIVFLLLQNMGYDAAYDLLKYCILSVWKIVCRKDAAPKETKIVVEMSEKDKEGQICRHRAMSISTSYQMSNEERERTVESLTEKLLVTEEG